MHRYKGSYSVKSVNSFNILLAKIKSVNIELIGDYTNIDAETIFRLDDIDIVTTPYRIIKNVVPSIIKFKNNINSIGFKVIKAIKYSGTLGITFLIDTGDGNYIDFTPASFSKFKDFRNCKIGRLTPIHPTRLPSGELAWKCKCDCQTYDKEPIIVKCAYLLNETKLSCGCLQKECAVNHANLTKNKAKNTFIKSIEYFGGIVVGDYVGNKTPVLCKFKDVSAYINPTAFKRTILALEKLIVLMNNNEDTLDSIIPVDNTGAFNIVVKTRDGLLLTFTLTSYPKFVDGRTLFINNLSKINGLLISPYSHSDDELLCNIGGNIRKIVPHRFNYYMKNSFVKIKNVIQDNGDTIVDILDFYNVGFLFRIKTFDGATVEFFSTGYFKFVESRKSFFKKCLSVNLQVLSPYIGAFNTIECKLDKAYLKSIPSRIQNSIIPTIEKMKKIIIANNDSLLEFIDYSSIGVKARIKTFDGAIVEYCYGNYIDFCRGRKSFFNKIKNNDYTVSSPYVKSVLPILIDFNCGHGTINTTPNRFITRGGCPICSLSKGELTIMEYLNKEHIDYIHQYKILSNNTKFSSYKYDIYIPLYKLIIEVHGIQHYEIDGYFNETQQDLDENILNDMNKYYYALENNYNYMIVDYREHKPEFALKRFKALFKPFLEDVNRTV